MNIIEAWKAAGVGQEIRRVSSPSVVITKRRWLDIDDPTGTHFVIDALVKDKGHPDSRMFDTYVLADDWEVVRKKNKLQLTLGMLMGRSRTTLTKLERDDIPDSAKVTIGWEE